VLAVAAGGARRLAERAEEACSDGDLALACELAEFAWLAEPEDDKTRGVRADVYRTRARAETSLMAKGIYNAAARDVEPENEPDPTG
jgi:alkyl sulfatase BDS1-like metallo-beta-lactamase superfamily hydrolase